MFWSTEKTDRLEALVEDGLSASEIAPQLGMTRNAIIGKCNREGFKLQQSSTKLSEDSVASIIAELVDGRWSQLTIAKRFGVCFSLVSHINTGRSRGQKTGASHDRPLRSNDVHMRHRAAGLVAASRATQGEE